MLGIDEINNRLSRIITDLDAELEIIHEIPDWEDICNNLAYVQFSLKELHRVIQPPSTDDRHNTVEMMKGY